MKNTKQLITITLFTLATLGSTKLQGMNNNVETKRMAANASEVAPLPKPLKNIICGYTTPFDWSWLPAFNVNITTLDGEHGHKESVNSIMQFNNHTIVSGDKNGIISVWDLEKQTIDTLQGHQQVVTRLVKLNEHIFASGSHDNTIKLWDIRTHKCIATLTGHTSFITCLIKLNDHTIVSGSYDYTVKLWDITNLEKAHCTHTFIHGVQSWSNYPCVISLIKLDENSIASGGKDKKIRIWDINKRRCIATLEGHEGAIWSLEKLNEHTLASGSHDGAIKIWDLKTGRCIADLEGHEKHEDNKHACLKGRLFDSPVYTLLKLDENIVASGSADRTIKLWDLRTKKCIRRFNTHTDHVRSLIKLDDCRFASCSGDKTIKIFEINREQLKTLHENLELLWMENPSDEEF